VTAPWEKYTRGARRLGRGKKLKRAGNAGKGKERKEAGLPPFPSSHRSPRSRFLSPALPLLFLSLVFTNRSLCGGERDLLGIATPLKEFLLPSF